MSSPVLLDTNILVDFLRDIPEAIETVRGNPDAAMSVISWMEVMAGVESDDDEQQTRKILSTFLVIGLTGPVIEEAVRIRGRREQKLPDAIILATARMTGRSLLTRNTKDFASSDPAVVIPYRL